MLLCFWHQLAMGIHFPRTDAPTRETEAEVAAFRLQQRQFMGVQQHGFRHPRQPHRGPSQPLSGAETGTESSGAGSGARPAPFNGTSQFMRHMELRRRTQRMTASSDDDDDEDDDEEEDDNDRHLDWYTLRRNNETDSAADTEDVLGTASHYRRRARRMIARARSIATTAIDDEEARQAEQQARLLRLVQMYNRPWMLRRQNSRGSSQPLKYYDYFCYDYSGDEY
ncbi:hypothetical protein CAOG_007509 [Capsaspora owczarzaki ATCC 30864]|uniref:Uncharacterized protein n=1 Tax=Capsaspora owczarzaki (strain ATCC 30864) TaxID=595528 RepID=A0A0D2WWR8_CAPO3|nr:hypothetical protein CAOG_007509 [Capsaspora owczarzaki ATCC 30864]